MSWRKYSVLLSVFIAIAMTAQPFVSALSSTDDNNPTPAAGPDIIKAEIPEEEQMEMPDSFTPPTPPSPPEEAMLPPDVDILLYDDFDVFTWDVENKTGLGNFTWNATMKWVDYIAGPSPYNVENDYMNKSFDINVDAACINSVKVKFYLWGEGDSVNVTVNGYYVSTETADTTYPRWHSVIIPTTYLNAPGTNVLSFHVRGIVSRDFHIDKVIVAINYTDDLAIDGIVGIECGGFVTTDEAYKLQQFKVNITNRGTTDATGVVVHLQVYKEEEQELYDWICWDMEDCFLNTWDTVSWDGDQATWYWTTKRYHSEGHSYACKPDYLDTYEAYSHDSLILHNCIRIPDTVVIDGIMYHVTAAYLTFWHWCEGEFGEDADYPVDYGQVFIDDCATGTSTAVSTMFYDTDGEWEWVDPYLVCDPRDTDGRNPIDISPWIGSEVRINFTWFSDGYINYEGWYIDDVCIVLDIASGQQLVFQGYWPEDANTGATIPAGETITIVFPGIFNPEPDTTYFIQVYHNYDDCILDNNEINCTVYYGDICEAELLDLQVDPYYEADPAYCGTIEQLVPIKVTVYNNGTLAEDVPVRVSVFHRVKETLFEDDFEDADISDWELAYTSLDTTGPYFPEHVTDYDANTGQYSLAFFTEVPNADRYYLNGMNQGIFTPSLDLPPDYALHTWFDFAAKWAMNISYWSDLFSRGPIFHCPYVDLFGVSYPIYYVGLLADLLKPYGFGDFDAWAPGLLDPMANALLFRYPTACKGWTISNDNNNIFMDELNNPGYHNPFRFMCDCSCCPPCTCPCENPDYGMSLFHIDLTDTIEYYQSLGYLTNKMQVGWFMATSSWNNVCVDSGLKPLDINYVGNWSGLMIDDVHIYYDFQGAKVWEKTKTVHLAPGESKVLWFNWTADDFCDYIIIATILLDCDMDPDDNSMDASTKIVARLYDDDYEEWEQEDNTYGLPDDWHIVEECSVCPDNHFWWNGKESMKSYDANVDHMLLINETFNLSGVPTGDITQVWLSFDTWFSLEDTYDFGMVEISNDSGMDWYVLDVFTGESSWYTTDPTGWMHLSYELVSWATTLAGLPMTFFTDQMHIRFRMWSDGGVEYKGWYIDNVNVSIVPAIDPIEVLFFDDMENATLSEEKLWIHMQTPVGCFWHEEDTFGNGPTSEWFWNGDESNSPYDADPYLAWYWADYWYSPWQPGDTVYDAWVFASLFSNNQYRVGVDEKLIIKYDLRQAYYAIMTWDYNYSFAEYYDSISEKVISWDYGYVEISTDNGSTWNLIKVFGGTYGDGLNTLWTTTPFNLADGTTIPAIAYGWRDRTVDLTPYVGGDYPVLLRFHFIDDGRDVTIDYGWLVDNITIIGKIDCVAPTVTATLSPAEPDGCDDWYKSAVTITLTAEDNVGVEAVYYSIDGGAYQLYTAPFTVSDDGSHVVTFYAVDKVGNTSPEGSVSFKIDKTAPTGSLTYPEAGYIYLFGRQLFKNPLGGTIIIGGMTFQATASDATSGVDYVHFEIDGMTYDDATTPYEFWWHKFDLIPKSYTITVTVHDEACNEASAGSLSFTHWL